MRATAVWSAVAVVCASASVSPAGEIRFRTRHDFAVGRSPTDFAFAAGRLFVAADEGVSAWQPDGGEWIPSGVLAEEPYVKSLAVADLNGDGREDIAYASRNSSQVMIRLGVDAGSVPAPALAVPVTSIPRRLRARALTAAGPPVLLVVHGAGLSLVRPDESGGFTAALVDDSPVTSDVEVVDLNGDDAFDLALAAEGKDSLRLLAATGDGGFAAAGELATLGRPTDVQALAPTPGGAGALFVVTDRGLVAHRRGPRGFEKAELLWNEPHLAGMATGDLDGDGHTDLAVTNRSRATLTFFRGHAQGRPTQAQSYTVGRAPQAALLVDFDADGVIDALTLNQLADSVTVLHGRGKGAFDANPCILGHTEDLDALASADFDRDGNLDLAVTSREGGSVSVFLGDGSGDFVPRPPLRVGGQPRGIVAGDFDDDDKPDLAVVNFAADEVAVLAGNGRGGFDAPILVPVGLGPTAIVAGPFGGAGHADLAVANSLSKSVSILYGDGRGRFPDVENFPVDSTPTFLLTADVDGDGYADLVVGSERDETVTMLHGDGQRLGPPQTNPLTAIARPSIAEDFNRDGRLDLVLVKESDDAIEILPGAAGGGFDPPLRFPVGRNPTAAATGDFDGDGLVDLAVVHAAARTISIVLNRSVIPRRHQVADSTSSARETPTASDRPGSAAPPPGVESNDGRSNLTAVPRRS